MEKIQVDEVESFLTNATVMRPLGKYLGAENVAINHFEVEPGDAFSAGYHTHYDQEEIFYILEGVATFETEEGEKTVREGEAIRFAAGELQHGYNEGGDTVVSLAIGAPKETEDVVVECPDCGELTPQDQTMNDSRTQITLSCTECGAVKARFD